MIQSNKEALLEIQKQVKTAVEYYHIRLVGLLRSRKDAGISAHLSEDDLEVELIAYQKELTDLLNKK